jgi:hypothetical protein
MRDVIGIGGLLAAAAAARIWLHSSTGWDITVHDVYRIILLKDVVFWLLIGSACVWLVLAARKLMDRKS